MSGKRRLFCFGYGYTADFLARALRDQDENWAIAGTTRERDKKAILRKHGIEAFVFSPESPLTDPMFCFKGMTHLLLTIPPGDEGDPAFLFHGLDLTKIDTLEWVGYLSTTGVYGDRDGEWVDETSEIRPSSKRGSRRVKAETQWLSLLKSHGLPVHIFRLAGIYGPGRSALDSVRAGVARRIYKPGQAFSRVHIEDIVNVLTASMARPDPGAAYNVCDDNPSPSHEIITYACELLGVEPPPIVDYEDADLAPIARSFYSDNKRVRNNRIKDELGVKLIYPDYKAGLKACLDVEQDLAQTLSMLQSDSDMRGQS